MESRASDSFAIECAVSRGTIKYLSPRIGMISAVLVVDADLISRKAAGNLRGGSVKHAGV